MKELNSIWQLLLGYRHQIAVGFQTHAVILMVLTPKPLQNQALAGHALLLCSTEKSNTRGSRCKEDSYYVIKDCFENGNVTSLFF